jgi:predicted RNA-binding Zn-ribbon protein involved in translation (DUF1610 family)
MKGEPQITHWYCPNCGAVLNGKTVKEHQCKVKPEFGGGKDN